MHAALPLRFTCTLPRRCMQVFVVLLRFSRDDGKEKRLLPFRRLAGAIKPSVGRLPWTTKRCDNDGSGIRSEGINEGHGQILPQKKKYAMQKIILALCLQCGQSKHMTATATQKMSRNEISRAASDIQDQARKQGDLARCDGNDRKQTKWACIEGRAQRLANDACECRWTLKMLRRRLVELRGEVAA